MQETGFTVDRDKCTGCGLCVKVCPGGVLSLDGTKTVRMAPFEEYGWNGCWQCEHCLAGVSCGRGLHLRAQAGGQPAAARATYSCAGCWTP